MKIPSAPPPCGHEPTYRRGLCRRCYNEWRVTVKAHERADDHPADALRDWDNSRARSKKTSEARAAGVFGVGPSDLNACTKAIELRERPPAGHEPIPMDKTAAWMGSLIDLALKRARRKRYPWRMFDVKVDIPGLDRPGEADEFDPVIGRVIDYKSAGRWKWEKYGTEGPSEGEWEQLCAYGLGLEAAGYDVRELEVIGVNRDNGVMESHRRPYNRRVAEQAVVKLHALVDALESGRELPRTRTGPTTDPICARFCPHVKTCWNLDDVPPGRTPENWLLAREDEAVERILVDYVAAHAAESPAKSKKTELKALLTGADPGRYGDVVLSWTGGNQLPPKPDPEARVTQLEESMRLARELGTPPDDPEILLYPQKSGRSNVSISVKPVRKAQLDEEARQRTAETS
ncbi:hypothetical protein [Phycicoccus sp.]|uniref:hypothetical protein n=1 Tax=Phycicoccus sp. TaxID=1902410 RepID=UPI002C224B9E|nr:hypothetical protein [Phycicoccus sp.]HMM95420.1 hypothetical protein [Phycicoccus sp.]